MKTIVVINCNYQNILSCRWDALKVHFTLGGQLISQIIRQTNCNAEKKKIFPTLYIVRISKSYMIRSIIKIN